MASRFCTRNFVMALAIAIVVVIAGDLNHARAQRYAPSPPPPRSHAHNDAVEPTTRPQIATPTTRPFSPLAPGERRLALQFTNGHDTDRRDHGRPVVLIAAALNVPSDVFRETFTHVHPAGPNAGGPTDAEARQNKAALMAGLSPYGVTDDRLNTVSNYYRYMRRNRDDLWQHRDAIGFVVVDADNKVVRFDLVDPGAGYTTPPTVSIQDQPNAHVNANLKLGTDLATNGSIESLAVVAPTTAPAR